MWVLARELTLDAAQSARSSRSTTKTLPAAHIKKLLDSRNDREVLDGLRRVIGVRLLALRELVTWNASDSYFEYGYC
jgi:hypothetical protein